MDCRKYNFRLPKVAKIKPTEVKKFTAVNWDVSSSGYTEDYDGWNDVTIKQRKSFLEFAPKYWEFNEKFRWNVTFHYFKVIEKEQDLFEMPKDYSLGHCVAEDLRMNSGISVTFKRKFKGLDDLLSQRQKQGGMAVLENNNRYIYYLVIKRISTGKPTYETFWSSLKKMREHMVTNGVQKLAIPKIGCGSDGLDWTKVKYMIEFLFKDVDVEIVVCKFQ